MSKSLRIRTTPDGEDKYLKVKLEQDFDFIEILSLKISQEDAYRNFCSDYGVVVGRVNINTGFGVPNAKVSIFIPLNDDDILDPEISDLYPYEVTTDVNGDGVRYNLLPNTSQNKDKCFTPIGSFPTKREILDNDELGGVYQKYYKYTTTTNSSGDYMFFGIPTGQYSVHVDADISDIGVISAKPYDLIRQGVNEKKFETPNKFREGPLNQLVQVKTASPIGTTVKPFWGNTDDCDLGITRVDINLNETLIPHAIFMGSIFGDDDKSAISKRCRPRRKTGNMEEVITSAGRIEMIRKTEGGSIERFDVEGGNVIDDDGVWSYQIPMNMDYMVTNEEGRLVPSNNQAIGLPTKARVRFRVGMDGDGSLGRLRTRAKFLIPNNPETQADADYSFGEDTKDESFKELSFNKIYSVKSFIPRFDNSPQLNNKSAISIKDVSKPVGGRTQFPFNKIDTDFNYLFIQLCLLITLVVGTLVFIFNAIVITVLNIVLYILNLILRGICRAVAFIATITCGLKHIGPGGGANRRACRCSACIGPCDDDDGDCTCPDGLIPYIPYIVLKCDEKCYAPFAFVRIPNTSATQNAYSDCTVIHWPDGVTDNTSEDTGDASNSAGVGPEGPSDGGDAGYFDCVTAVLARALNVFEFLFYNDWINGTLYSTLFKYKIRKKGAGREKYCEYDCDEFTNYPNYTGVNNDAETGDTDPDNKCRINYIVESGLCTCGISGERKGIGCDDNIRIRDGLIKQVDDNFYYASITHDGGWPLFKTDIINMGSILDCDWEGVPRIIQEFPETTYHLPSIISDDDGTSGIDPLFASINCFTVDTDEDNVSNLKRYCELGVGDDEDRTEEYPSGGDSDEFIQNNDIENQVIRNIFAWSNDSVLSASPLTSVDTGFIGYNCEGIGLADYNQFRYKTTANLSSKERLKDFKDSFYFYFGLNAGKTAIRKTQKRFFQECLVEKDNTFSVIGDVINVTTSVLGSITITVDGGIAPYEYSWSGPAGFTSSSKDIVNLVTGTYTLQVLDDSNNLVTTTFIVGGPAALSFVLNATNEMSIAGNDGTLDVTFIGGGAGSPYTLTVNGGTLSFSDASYTSTSKHFDNLIAGTYTVTLYDGNTTYSDSIIIEEPPALSVTLVKVDTACPLSESGSINSTPVGGIAPYTYSWVGSNGLSRTTRNINGLGVGAYQVSVIDSVYAVAVGALNIVSTSSISFSSASVKHCGCKGGNNGSITAQAVGDGPFDYGLDGTVLVTNTNGSFNTGAVLPPNTYSTEARNVDGCVTSTDIPVIEPPQPTVGSTMSASILSTAQPVSSDPCKTAFKYSISRTAASGGWSDKIYVWEYYIAGVTSGWDTFSNGQGGGFSDIRPYNYNGGTNTTMYMRIRVRDSDSSSYNLCSWIYSNTLTLAAGLTNC